MFDWLANPNRFKRITNKLEPFLIVISIILIASGLYFGLFDSPKDYQQGDAVRIMYVHVPSAWLASFLFLSLAVSCIFYLAWKHPLADIISNTIAPIGAMFSVLTLLTGSLWGKPMWGTWWVWDARLTSVLILFFFYIGYIIFSKSFNDFSKGEKFSSILSIIGLLNIPIIKFSVDYWNTLHQPASISKIGSPSIHVDMMIPLLIMTFAFVFIFIHLLIIRLQIELNDRRLNIKNMRSYGDL